MAVTEEAIFRSADMCLIQLYIPQEIAREMVYTVGQMGLVQFRDLNRKVNAFQRTFVDDLKRLDNVERQYRFFDKLLKKHGIPLFEGSPWEDNGQLTLAPATGVIDDHAQSANILEERLKQMEDAAEQLELQKADLEQYRFLLQTGEQFFAKDPSLVVVEREADAEAALGGLSESVNYVTGVISSKKVGVLEQILWRVLRGNLYFRHVSLGEPVYDAKHKEHIRKSAFIVFSHGDLIMKRIRKIAESLDASLYEVRESPEARSKQLQKVNQGLSDLYTVLETTSTTLNSELYAVARELYGWYQDVSHEKHVYETLNRFDFDVGRKTLIGEGWLPTDELGNLQSRLREVTQTLGVEVPSIIEVLETNKTPPTFHRLNKFTAGFQSICDCYGVPQYKEVNPGLPTVVTFPFMFAIMFGDMGHGMIMTLVAALLVMNESTLEVMKRGEIFDMMYSGRYIVLMMGLFSVYTGSLYNDLFSKSLTIFPSGWRWPDHWQVGELITAHQVGTYPYGLDWVWHSTDNGLLFSNSYKMKLSILMGMAHMTYSYFFSLVNHIYFGSWIDIFGSFIPGLLFMQSIFGYLSIAIIYKWARDWVKDGKPAPSLLNMLINMFLSPGTVDDELYPHQSGVQVFLLLLALVCIPWLLLAKPVYFIIKKRASHESASPEQQPLLESSQDELPEAQEGEEDDDDEDESHGEAISDLVIHQVIYTIEFCLNSVSHTASYLRLWALSLAHAQLSQVLWDMTIKLAFGPTGFLGVCMTVFLFSVWFVLTCAVLVCMEGTSAMLHSLRLHWVESMSKFFIGDGVAYEPFQLRPEEIE
ncbi:VPH1 (YOR270C) [Zygosaccharomyces parabailii]|nr:VPH1 (YOR270C) [Zygosaccharomyces parabailii]